MSDMAADKLFTRFFKSNKVATIDAYGSDYAPMAPDWHGNLRKMELPVRGLYFSEADPAPGPDILPTGKLLRKGRGFNTQRFYGEYTPSANHVESRFSFYKTREKTPEDNYFSGNFFIYRDSYQAPLKTIDGETRRADFIVVPKGGNSKEESKYRVIVDGLEILPTGKLLRIDTNELLNVSKEILTENMKTRERLLSKDGAIRDYLISLDADHSGLKMGDVYRDLREGMGIENDVWIGSLHTRQPRNSMNDVVIAKIRREQKDAQLKLDARKRKGEQFLNRKGEVVYDVLVDVYEHPQLTSSDKTPRDVWIIEPSKTSQPIIEAESKIAFQVKAMKKGLGGATNYANNAERVGTDGEYILRDLKKDREIISIYLLKVLQHIKDYYPVWKAQM